MAVAAAVALLGLLPVAGLIPGGHAIQHFDRLGASWLWGTVSVVLVGLLLAMVWQRAGHPRFEGLWSRLAARAEARPKVALALLFGVTLVLYAAVSTWVFSRRPLLIDEIIQQFQARVFGQGKLWLPATGLPEFFGAMHLVETPTRVYGQFPPGATLMLLPGELLGAAWLTGPICGAISAVLWPLVLRRVEPSSSARLGATLLFAFTPFTVFLSGSYMNHVTVLTWVLLSYAALARVTDQGDALRPGWAALCGFALGAAATIRPLDAFAFAAPIAVWLLLRAVREPRRWREALAALAGVAVPMSWLMWMNDVTNGSPFLFGYQVLWGKAHNLGFHQAPWGPDHTPARGVELINLYLIRLQTYFLETPFPALLPLIGAVALSWAPLSAFDRLLAASTGIMVAFYFAYWHDGFYLGPRFFFPLAPVLALWTARFPGIIRGRWGEGLAYKAVVSTLFAGGLVALALGVPARAREYRNGLLTMRWNADSAAAAAGVSNALVLVRESWGSQLGVRMWGLGLSRSDAEKLYAHVDACQLEEHVTALERTTIRGARAKELMWVLLADSSLLGPTPYSQDHSERWQSNLRYTDRCTRRQLDDRRGFTLYTPLILAQRAGVTYARDLHERDTVLLRRYPDRRLWLLKPASDSVGAAPVFFPVSRDSLLAEWALEAAPVSVQPAEAEGAAPRRP